MKQYYYTQYDKECGPCAESTIANMIRSGVADVWVRLDGDDQWYPISDLPDEVLPAGKSLRSPVMPPALTRVTKKSLNIREIDYKARTIIMVSWVFLVLGGLGLLWIIMAGVLSGDAQFLGESFLLGAVACIIGCAPFVVYLLLGQSIRRITRKD